MSVQRRDLLLGAAATAAAWGAPRLPEAKAISRDGWRKADEIVRLIRAPRIAIRRFVITQFGAHGDGRTPATQAINAAIEACQSSGGGQVIVPEGRFLTGAVRLRSGVELFLARGSVLAFSTDPGDYPLVPTRWEGVELINHAPLIYANGEHDVAIGGEGVIDGQGSNANWWSWSSGERFGWREGMPDQRAARRRLFAMAEAGVAVSERVFGIGDYLRPPMIQFQNCERVRVEGVTLRNPPFWALHPVLCRDVLIRGVTFIGHGPNNDGCDPESVERMLIERCIFDNGDDCIAIKSGRNADGRRIARPSRDIVIRDCRMRSGHGGVVIGSEISGGVYNVFAERCTMDSPDLWYAIRFKNNALRGGVLEHFRFRDIAVGQVKHAAIICDFNYEEGATGAFTPVLRDVVVDRMTAIAAPRVLDLQGLPKAPVRDVLLRDCRFEGVRESDIVQHAANIQIQRSHVNGKVYSIR
jgi:polygalacturonase